MQRCDWLDSSEDNRFSGSIHMLRVPIVGAQQRLAAADHYGNGADSRGPADGDIGFRAERGPARC